MTFEELKHLIAAYSEWAWILQVFVVVFCVLLLNYLLRRALDRLQQRLKRTRTPCPYTSPKL